MIGVRVKDLMDGGENIELSEKESRVICLKDVVCWLFFFILFKVINL